MSDNDSKLYIANRQIPLTEGGKAAFASLEQVLLVFTEQETVLMLNRWLDYTAIQRRAHKKYSAKGTIALEPFKKKARELFGVSWDVLSDPERAAVLEAVRKDLTGPDTQASALRGKIPIRGGVTK